MLTWRRTFVTSLARLNHSSPTTAPSPTLLRCAQVLQNSQQKPCSLEDQEIKLHGFIRSVRKQKRFAFAEISDGSAVSAVQAILNPVQAAEYVPSFCARFLSRISLIGFVVTGYQPGPRLRYQAYGRLAHLARNRVMSCRRQR